MDAPIAWLAWTGLHMSPWKLIGLTGALLFGARWAVQFLASRRARRPVIPRAFWVMSLVGSAMTLGYFLFSQKQDAVGVLQNLFPAFTAAYSLWLDLRQRDRQRPSSTVATEAASSPAAHSGSVPVEATRPAMSSDSNARRSSSSAIAPRGATTPG